MGLSLEETEGISLQDKIAQSKFKDDIHIATDKMKISASLMKSIFKKPVSRTVQHVSELFEMEDLRGTDTILMVGGIAESDVLQKAIREYFSNKKVITPLMAGLVVLKEAVVFGHDPNIMRDRVCKNTYGVETSIAFDPRIHPFVSRVTRNGVGYFDFAIDKYVEIGQTVICREAQVSRAYIPFYEQQTSLSFAIYASTNRSPISVHDVSCIKLGEVNVDILDTSVPLERRSVLVGFTFSVTKIEVKAKERVTGRVVCATVNFLG